MLRCAWRRLFAQIAKPPTPKAHAKHKAQATAAPGTHHASTAKAPVATTNLMPRAATPPKSIPVYPSSDPSSTSPFFRYDPPEALTRTTKLAQSLTTAAKGLNGHFYVHRPALIDAVKGRIAAQHPLIMVDGPRGAGKSVLLYQLALQLRQEAADASVLYLADGADWTTGRWAYYPLGDGTFVQPELAMAVLAAIKGQLGCAVDLPQDGAAFSGALPLLQQTMQALAKSKHLIVIVDGANAIVDGGTASGYNDPQGSPIPVGQLPVISAILQAAPKDSRKTIIAATTKSNPELKEARVPPATCVAVPKYTAAEVASCLELYRQLGHLTVPEAGDYTEFVKFKAFVSGGNPQLLYKLCEYDAIYQ